jgi:hypothetical protein
MMFGILIIAVIFAALVAVRLLTRRKSEVLVVSSNRELALKRPATVTQVFTLGAGGEAYLDHVEKTTTNPTLLNAIAEVRADSARTDTVMMGAINPADYPWAAKV